MNIIRASPIPYSKLTIHEPLLVCIMENLSFGNSELIWKKILKCKQILFIFLNSFYAEMMFFYSPFYMKNIIISDFLCKNYCSTNCCLSLSSSSRSLCIFKLFVSYAKEFYNRIVQRGNMKVVFPERD